MTNENSVMIDDVEYTVLQAKSVSDACDRCDVRDDCWSRRCSYVNACTSVEFG